jgi:recombinational DNA repair protein (RecF pathway)
MASKVWLHCYNCGEQFQTEVGYAYSSKQLCGECRNPKPEAEVVVELSRYYKRKLAGQAKRKAKLEAEAGAN